MSLDRLSRRGIYLLVFLGPLFWLPLTFEHWEFPKVFLLFFGSLALLIWKTVRELWPFDPVRGPAPDGAGSRQWRLTFNGVDVLVLLFWLVALASLVFSMDPLASLFGFYGRFGQGLVALTGYLFLYFLVSRFVLGRAKHRLIEALLWSGFVAMVVAYLAIFGVLKPANFNPVAPSLEGLLAFLAPLFFLCLTGLSTKWLGLLKVLFAVLVLGLMVVFFWNWPPSFAGRVPREVTLDQTASWQISRDALRDRPLLGSGPGTFFYDFSRYKKPDFNQGPLWSIRFDRPISQITEVVATTGLLGFLIYLVLITTVLKSKFQSTNSKTNPNSQNPISPETRVAGNSKSGNLFLAFLATVVVQFFYYQTVASGLVFWLLLALLAGQTARVKELDFSRFSQRLRDSRLALVALGVLASLAIFYPVFWGVKILAADVFYARAMRRTNPAEKLAELQKAAATNPVFAEYQILLSRSQLSQAQTLEQVQLAIAAGQRATQLSPRWAAAWEALALAYQKAGPAAANSPDWSLQAFDRAIALEPTNPWLFSERGQVFWEKKDLVAARKDFLASRNLKPDWSDAWIFLALNDEREGKISQAIKTLEHRQGRDLFNTNILFQLGRIYFNEGRNPEAAQRFEQVLGLNPNHLDALYSLALVREKQGKKEEAVRLLQKALQLSPANPMITSKLTELQKK